MNGIVRRLETLDLAAWKKALFRKFFYCPGANAPNNPNLAIANN
ncbi:hypothetical protein [Nostoc sp.]